MRLYLSSYGIGNHGAELVRLVGKESAKIAVSINAVDYSDDLERKSQRLERELETMEALGFQAEALDLRDYFNSDQIIEHLKKYDAVWFSGGNTFILAKAFRQSGFDRVLEELVKTGKLVYAGYSAAFCVLHSSLRGVELVDDKDAAAEGYQDGEIWEGMGLIDFYPIVHFRSDHHESDDVEKEYSYILENNLTHMTFRDGDIYIFENGLGRRLT